MSEALTKVRKARSAVVQAAPFFGSLLLRQKLIETTAVETMSTNGKELFFNPDFVMATPPDELQAVNVHEAFHPAMNHHTRRGDRDPDIWNKACDYVINPPIKRAGFHLPAGALFRDDLAGLTAEKAYDVLMREQQQDDGDSGDDGDQQPGDDQSQGGDDQQPGDDQQDAGDGDQQGGGQYGKDHGGTGNFTDAPCDTPEEMATEEREWRTALTQAANMAGTIPADIEGMVREILEPQAPWRELLRRFMDAFAKEDYSWQRPNRRFIADGLYLPSTHSEAMPPLLVAIDASGSMPQGALQEVANELQSIIDELQPERVDVLVHNTRVGEVRSFEPGDEVDFSARASGGTRFAPVCDWINDADEQYACAVWFTDLEPSDWSRCEEPAVPVLWIDYLGKHDAPFGEEVIVMEEAA